RPAYAPPRKSADGSGKECGPPQRSPRPKGGYDTLCPFLKPNPLRKLNEFGTRAGSAWRQHNRLPVYRLLKSPQFAPISVGIETWPMTGPLRLVTDGRARFRLLQNRRPGTKAARIREPRPTCTPLVKELLDEYGNREVV